MNKRTELRIVHDHEVNRLSYRMLGKKYGICHTTIYEMIKSRKKFKSKEMPQAAPLLEEAALPDDLAALKEELRKARLTIALQDLIIDIGSKELGVELRKKHVTKRSK